jgi:MFS family permease
LMALGIAIRPRPVAAGPTRIPAVTGTGLAPLARRSFATLFHDVRDVLRVVATNRLVGFVMASILVTMFVSSVSYTVLLFMVQQVLGLGTGGVGIFAGVLAVGMIAGAVVMAFVKRRVNRPAVVVAVVFLYGLLFLAGPWLMSLWFMVVVALVAGVAFSWLGVVQNTMLQEEVAPEIRGRIFSTREFVSNGAFLLTTLFIGALGDLTSYRTVLGVIGVVLVALAAAGLAFVRRLPRPVGD